MSISREEVVDLSRPLITLNESEKPKRRVSLPRPKRDVKPRYPGQRVVGFIGVPGSGKSTLSANYKAADGWVTLTLDDVRQTLWPPHRRVYWDVRQGERGDAAQRLLHAMQQTAINTALYEGFSVVLPDTHVSLPAFRRELEIIADHGILVEWKLFAVTFDELVRRNNTRDPLHRVPDSVLYSAYSALWAKDAWWRSLPSDQIEIIDQTKDMAA